MNDTTGIRSKQLISPLVWSRFMLDVYFSVLRFVYLLDLFLFMFHVFVLF
jgi:hypothetical protein